MGLIGTMEGVPRAGATGDMLGGRSVPDSSARVVCMTLGTALAGGREPDFGEVAGGNDPPPNSAPPASADRSFVGVRFPKLG